jgi:hypothetical protein
MQKRLIIVGLIAVFFLIFSVQALAFQIGSGTIVASCEKVGEQYFIDYTINSTADGIGLLHLNYELQVSSPLSILSIIDSFPTIPQGNVSVSGFIAAEPGTFTLEGLLYWAGISFFNDYPLSPITVECEAYRAGGEGCGPGFWKNHEDDWETTEYSLGDDFDTTFGVDYFDPDITLSDAIRARGGGLKKIARHGTAALLNASSHAVEYDFGTDEIIDAVKNGDVDFLLDYNELSAAGFCD